MNQSIENDALQFSLPSEIETGFQAWRSGWAGSPEIDFGCGWVLDASALNFPRWRISWVEATGVLYAACLDQGTPDRYITLTYFGDAESVKQAMVGWVGIMPDLPTIVMQARRAAFADCPVERRRG